MSSFFYLKQQVSSIESGLGFCGLHNGSTGFIPIEQRPEPPPAESLPADRFPAIGLRSRRVMRNRL
jgi:hypothetical protein